MPEINPASARVVDPILSTYVQGYRQPGMIGGALFPRVPVAVAGGQIIEFGKEAFRTYNLRRAPGAGTRRVTFGYAGKPYACVQDALEMPLPREFVRDAAIVPGINLGQRAVKLGMDIIGLSLERDQAALATTAANYDAQHKVTLAGGTKWSSATGVPIADIKAAREAIRASTGMYPNTLALSAVAFNAISENPSVLERIKYSEKAVITLDILKAVLDIPEIVVGKAISADDAGAFSDVWGNNAVLAYVPPGPSSQEEPSYGYTYTLDGHPLVEETYYDKNQKSWVYPVTMERAPVLSGITAGYLFVNPN